uniref:Uncharacterized protein n=1 Tax=Parascaris equorum TaxID=6256 RepID=A0A914RLM6_PAREQ
MKGCTKIAPAEFHNLVVLANRRLEQSEREGHSGYICGKTTVLNNLRFSILKAESFWHQLLYEGTYKHSRYLYASSDCASKCKWPIFPSTCQMVTYNDEIIKELYFRRMAHMILFECNTKECRKVLVGLVQLDVEYIYWRIFGKISLTKVVLDHDVFISHTQMDEYCVCLAFDNTFFPLDPIGFEEKAVE